MLYVPVPDRVVEAITTPVPMDMSSSSNAPVGIVVPEVGVTVPVKVTLAPIVDEDGPASVTLVPVSAGAAQLASRFVTFTEPRPVAKSYPVPVLNAAVLPPFAVAKIPN
jgi:hypothetical protein